MLRDYQQRAIDQLYDWFRRNAEGHPCLVLPTGSGKSHVVAALCKDALQNWPETRVLMLTHVRELIEQNADKMRQHWPGAPLGIYSAGLRKRELGEPITFAGIQSVRNKADKLGHIDLVIVDECHLINHRQEGGYRKLIDDLGKINPALRVIGLTATPYRLGHGYITDGDALFDDLIEPVTIEELVHRGFLAPVRSKVTDLKLETDGVHKRGGEYIEAELQAAVNQPLKNDQVVREVIKLAGHRRAWLFFCAGVKHAEAIADLLNQYGVTAACVTGDTPMAERDHILTEYKAGRIRALTNANVLTTGFDYPDIDLIAMLRPTLSPTLYVQMVGRGMRLKSNADHCLVLDFAGCVQTHGPITAVRPPEQGMQGAGEAPVKLCPNCDEIVHLSARTCEACGYEFPVLEKRYELHDVDIMGAATNVMDVTDWRWADHLSRSSGKEMVKVTYYGALSDRPITEYLPILHDGYAGKKAMANLVSIAAQAGSAIPNGGTLTDLCERLNDGQKPDQIKYMKDGKFNRVTKRVWNETRET